MCVYVYVYLYGLKKLNSVTKKYEIMYYYGWCVLIKQPSNDDKLTDYYMK